MRSFIALLFCLCLLQSARAEIAIGVAGPLTGQNAPYGNELRSGVLAAVNAINASGGVNGETLSIVEGDDACDAKRALDVSKMFISRDVRLVVGHFCSSASLATAPAYNDAGILVINPAVTAPDLTSRNLWNMFRLTGRDDAQAEIAANRIKSDGQGADLFIINDGQIETVALSKRFLATLSTAKTLTVKAGSAKLPDDPSLIVASAFYLALQPADAAIVAKDIKKINPTAPLYGPDLLQPESYGAREEAATNGTRITFLRDSLATANTRTLGTLSVTEGAALNAFAAVEVFVAAAKNRDVNDNRAMATWLTAGNEVKTIMGPIRFNGAGDLQQQPYVWYEWNNGVLRAE